MTGNELYNKSKEYLDDMDNEACDPNYNLIKDLFVRCQLMEKFIGTVMVDNYGLLVTNQTIDTLKTRMERMEIEFSKLKPSLTAIFDEELWKEMGYDV